MEIYPEKDLFQDIAAFRDEFGGTSPSVAVDHVLMMASLAMDIQSEGIAKLGGTPEGPFMEIPVKDIFARAATVMREMTAEEPYVLDITQAKRLEDLHAQSLRDGLRTPLATKGETFTAAVSVANATLRVIKEICADKRHGNARAEREEADVKAKLRQAQRSRAPA